MIFIFEKNTYCIKPCPRRSFFIHFISNDTPCGSLHNFLFIDFLVSLFFKITIKKSSDKTNYRVYNKPDNSFSCHYSFFLNK